MAPRRRGRRSVYERAAAVSRRYPSNAGMAINNCQIINWIIMKLAIYMKLWRVKHENTAWHTALQESDEFEVPGWEDLKGAIAAF